MIMSSSRGALHGGGKFATMVVMATAPRKKVRIALHKALPRPWTKNLGVQKM